MDSVDRNQAQPSPEVAESSPNFVQDTHVIPTISDESQKECGQHETVPHCFTLDDSQKTGCFGREMFVTMNKRRRSGNLKKYLYFVFGGLLIVAIIIGAVLLTGTEERHADYIIASSYVDVENVTESSSEADIPPSHNLHQKRLEIPNELNLSTTAKVNNIEGSVTPFSVSPNATDKSKKLLNDYVSDAAEIVFSVRNPNSENGLEKITKSKAETKNMTANFVTEVERQLEAMEDVDVAFARYINIRKGNKITLLIGWINRGDSNYESIKTVLSNWTEVGLPNRCIRDNGGCSDKCDFDKSLLHFVCSCPEDQFLHKNNKTCVDRPVLLSLPTEMY